MENDKNIKDSIFRTLYELDVREKLEKKKSGGNSLDYLNWAHAWAEVKLRYPDANYEVWKFGEDNLPYQYDPETGYMVWVSTTIQGETHDMWLPVMDGANKAMKAEPYTYTTRSGERTVESATMYDINKTIMRCFVKCLGMHGIGLSLYFKECIAPEASQKIKKQKEDEKKAKEEELKPCKNEILELMKKMIENGINKDSIYEEIKKITGKKNPNAISSIEKGKEVVDVLNKMQASFLEEHKKGE